MNALGNIFWLLFGGILIALEYLVSSLLLMITIIGIPFGLQTLKMGAMALWPFGKQIKKRKSSGGFSLLMNIIWILLGGIWICLSHLLFAIICAVSIIGIPFAMQHIKLAQLALMPFGKEIVTNK